MRTETKYAVALSLVVTGAMALVLCFDVHSRIGRIDDCLRALDYAWCGVADDDSVNLHIHAVCRKAPFTPLLSEDHNLLSAVFELKRMYPQMFSQLFSRSERKYAVSSQDGLFWSVSGAWCYVALNAMNHSPPYFDVPPIPVDRIKRFTHFGGKLCLMS